MRRRPLLLCACVFVLGLLYGKQSGWYLPILVSIIAAYAGLPFFTAHYFGKGVWRCIWIAVAFFAGILHMQTQTAFRTAELAQIRDGESISLSGQIYKKEIKNDQLLVYLKNCYAVSNSEQLACNQVLLYQTSDEFSIGDILLVNGKVNMFQSATNEGMFDSKGYYYSQKLDFAIRQGEVSLLQRTASPAAEAMWQLRQRVAEIYTEATDAITAGVLSVMLLGEKSTLDSEVKELYQSMGISHILAISGLHVSLIGLGIYRFLRRRGIRYSVSFALSGVLLYLYALLTGASVSTKRAVGMLFLLMLADLWGRAYDSQNALGAMILYLLWENPFLLEYAGFTLSVAAVLGVATVGSAIQVGSREEQPLMTRVEMEDAEGEPEEEALTARAETRKTGRASEGRPFLKRVETGETGIASEGRPFLKRVETGETGRASEGRPLMKRVETGETGIASERRPLMKRAETGETGIASERRPLMKRAETVDTGRRQDERRSAGRRTDNANRIMNAVYMGVGIWLFTLPLIAFYYYEVPLYSALLNLFVVPLLKYLILLGAAGAVVGVFGGIVFGGGSSLSVASLRIVSYILLPCRWILNWYDTAANACLKLPLARIIVGKPQALRLVIYYAAIAVFSVLWMKRREKHWIRLVGVAAVFAILIIPTPVKFEMDVLDVGQGDGTYICSKEGISLFIDGGSTNVSSVGTYRILPFLKSKGIRKISYWFVSHADADHISGLSEALEGGYAIDNLILANRNVEDSSWETLIQLAESAGANIIFMKTGDVLDLGQTTITCLSPDADNTYEDRNDGGLVLLYRDAQFSAMFAGDISSEVEETLVQKYAGNMQIESESPAGKSESPASESESMASELESMEGESESTARKSESMEGESENTASDSEITASESEQLTYAANLLDVDFYKVDHHGSRYSSSSDWLTALTPRITTISCSSSNTYGHPHEETLDRLDEVGTAVYRTDELGEITLFIKDGEIAVTYFINE